MAPTVRVGLLGTGSISRRHFGALRRLREEAEVVAVCDVIDERVRAAAAPVGAVPYLSFHEMLTREKLDALYVCLPPDAHVDQELAAAAAGIHLFVEKPLPLDLAKAEAIARAVAAAGIVTAVGYHWRHFSHVQHLRAALGSERTGMLLGHFLSGLPDGAWWRIRARSGGQVVEQAIHLFDTARYLLGEVERVSAAYALRGNADAPGYDQDDVYTVGLRFRSGAIGTISATCILHRRWQVGLDVLCKDRAYRLREDALEVDDAAGVRRVALDNDPAFDENAAFIRAAAGGPRAAILSDYADAVRTQRVVLAANAAAASGQPVVLPS